MTSNMTIIAASLLLFLYACGIRIIAGVAGFSEEQMKTQTGKKSRSREQSAANAHRWAENMAKRPPSLVETLIAFRPVFDILNAIKSGEVDAINDRPVMRGWSPNEYLETAAALDGWVSCWKRIVSGEKLTLDISPMARIQQCLATGNMIDEQTLADAIAVTYDCYQAYRRIPRKRLREYSTEEMIQIEVDRLSLSTTKDN